MKSGQKWNIGQDLKREGMTKHEETYMSLSIEQRKKLEEISIKHGNVVKEIMKELATIRRDGFFRWSTIYGYIDFVIYPE